jgi:hypothetical protein
LKPLEILGLTFAVVILAISLFVYAETPSSGYLVLPALLTFGIAAYLWRRSRRVKSG